jgi:hypothetical protein
VQNKITQFTERDILVNARNLALENKVNSLLSLDVLAQTKTNDPEEKKKLRKEKIKFESALKRFTDLIEIIDKRLKVTK